MVNQGEVFRSEYSMEDVLQIWKRLAGWILLTMPVQRQFDDLFARDRCFDAPLIRLETVRV